MRLKSIQIAAGLGAAIAFILALMAAGALLLSLLFAAIGAALVAWLVYGVARTMLERKLARPEPDDGHASLQKPAS